MNRKLADQLGDLSRKYDDLSRFAKVYFDWQHAVFGSPVYYRPGAQQLTSDLFWFRFQVYF